MATSNLKIKLTTATGTKSLVMPKSTATIGSAAHCDVRLEHASVEPEHARAWFEGGRLWVQDLGSARGTYLNGSRLPAMKPMLVRDLDALKIGESAEVLGFDKLGTEPIRAPRVAQPAVNYDATLTEIRPGPIAAPAQPTVDETRVRQERAQVSRELAELRLQLQMAQLEKSSIDDLRGQGHELKAELRRLEDERREFKETLEQLRRAEGARQEQLERDLEAKRAKVERELTEMRDHHGRALGQWKLDVVREVNRQVRGLFAERAHALIKTPVTAQMLHGFETEISGFVHALILEEDAHGGKVSEITRSHAAQVPPPAAAPGLSGSRLKKAIGAGLLVAMVAVGIEYYRLRKPAGDSRSPASLSHWRPAQTRLAKPTITDNVIYTEDFLRIIDGPTWRKARGAELARAPWNFDERTVNALLDREKRLAHDLAQIEARMVEGKEQDTITAMHTREAEYTRALLASFQGDQNAFGRFVQTRTATLDSVLRR